MSRNIGYATDDASSPLTPRSFDRPKVGAEDVLIDIAFCGVCHSDVHQARDEFDGVLATNFPCMPGHEIAGTVAEVGAKVTAHRVGDRVGVGCLVYWGDESQRGVQEEQYQDPPAVFTYNTKDPDTGEVTFGGYSDQIVVHEHFVLKIPDALALDAAAPILCAGVTTWSPMQHWDIGAGHTVGVAGGGGLGHLAIKLLKARGAQKVVALTTTPAKADELRASGADDVVAMGQEDRLGDYASSMDFVMSTIPTAFDMKPYLGLLKHDGVLVTVGMLEPVQAEAIDFAVVSLNRLTIAGSLIGSLAETQDVLDFCAEHHITPDIEVIAADQVNHAFDEVVKGDVRFRYVIDNATLPAADR